MGQRFNGNLLGLILKNQSSRGFYRMVVRQRQIDGLIKTDQRRILPTAFPQQQEEHRGWDEYLKAPGAHKGCDENAPTVAQQVSGGGSNLMSPSPSSVVRIVLL